MTKQEYKRLSHNIRAFARKWASIHGRTSTRTEMHNVCYWQDTYAIDKYGRYQNTYDCIGDSDIGLVWRKAHNVCNNVYNFI